MIIFTEKHKIHYKIRFIDMLKIKKRDVQKLIRSINFKEVTKMGGLPSHIHQNKD